MRKLKNEELQRKSVEEFWSSEKTPVIIVLDNVRSMLNVGSVFRTADAFLAEAIYLCGYTGTPPHRELEKTALGATSTVSWKHFNHVTDAIGELKKNGWKVYAVEQAEKAVPLDKFLPVKKIALIFGNVISGVQQEAINACDGVIEIPQSGMKHSLNIAVSAGVVVWEIFRKLKN
jgi:tRNA G18 (ribose-2'-O)-methylase SpoU